MALDGVFDCHFEERLGCCSIGSPASFLEVGDAALKGYKVFVVAIAPIPSDATQEVDDGGVGCHGSEGAVLTDFGVCLLSYIIRFNTMDDACHLGDGSKEFGDNELIKSCS
jgi:hypothetical protein